MASIDSDSDSEYQQNSHFSMSATNTTTETDENSTSSSEESADSISTTEINESSSIKRKHGDSKVEYHELLPKKMKTAWSQSYSDKAMNMMKKMGYDKSKGLGKQGQGIHEPVEASSQVGRRGFGLKLENLGESADQWNASLEKIQIPEPIIWLKNNSNFLDNIEMDDLVTLVQTAPRKLTIDDETKFCNPLTLENILKSKDVFNTLNPNDIRRARSRSNPFETIRGSIFLNRAAVKMANIDTLCNNMFTNPVDENGKSLIKDDDLLYFADICAGPGGFSEYVLYRKGWEAKGFGFTLKNDNDFKLHDFYAGSPETFDPYYGINGDGDIFDPSNQESFADYVLKQTESGVHFVMADGGFSVEGKENIQEIVSKQLYLCQCLTALFILREKGHFVCKLFDTFTPFTVGLIYLMWKCFDQISICKPNTSRPANSERYLICKWKKPNTDTVRRHLFDINKQMHEDPNSEYDIYELVSYDELIKDKEFIDYIFDTNERIGKNQIIGLIKIAAYCKDIKLKEPLQNESKKKCLDAWNLPDEMRKAPDIPTNEKLLSDLLKEWNNDDQMMKNQPHELKSNNDLHKHFKTNIYDWYFVPVCREDTEKNIKTFFLCKGRNHIQRLSPTGRWEPIDLYLEISPNTLIYGEIVTELIGENRSQNQANSLHIIDGISLGGKDIHRLPLKERLKWCNKFAKALNKPYKHIKNIETSQIPIPIRCKKLYTLYEIRLFFDEMRLYRLKNGQDRLGYRIRSDDNSVERFFVPGGLMFFNEMNPQYVCGLSRQHKKFYYYNCQNKESIYIEDVPEQMKMTYFASFRACFNRRLLWKWTYLHQVTQNLEIKYRVPDTLFVDDLNEFICKISSR